MNRLKELLMRIKVDPENAGYWFLLFVVHNYTRKEVEQALNELGY